MNKKKTFRKKILYPIWYIIGKMGNIIFVTGCMFAGKSAWLIDALKKHTADNKKVLAVRYSKDNRYSKNSIASHNGLTFRAENAATLQDIKDLLEECKDFDVFGIDEIQFFEKGLADILLELKKNQKIVYAAGLDTDFLANPWDASLAVEKIADEIHTLKAICSVCSKNNATRTQRLINGKPASRKSPRILIADTDSYTARCVEHHEIPD